MLFFLPSNEFIHFYLFVRCINSSYLSVLLRNFTFSNYSSKEGPIKNRNCREKSSFICISEEHHEWKNNTMIIFCMEEKTWFQRIEMREKQQFFKSSQVESERGRWPGFQKLSFANSILQFSFITPVALKILSLEKIMHQRVPSATYVQSSLGVASHYNMRIILENDARFTFQEQKYHFFSWCLSMK